MVYTKLCSWPRSRIVAVVRVVVVVVVVPLFGEANNVSGEMSCGVMQLTD